MSEELTIRNLALKIANDFNTSEKDRTDGLLRLNMVAHSNLGTDSLLSEKKKVQSDSKFIFKEINKIDKKLGTLLISHMDKPLDDVRG